MSDLSDLRLRLKQALAAKKIYQENGLDPARHARQAVLLQRQIETLTIPAHTSALSQAVSKASRVTA